MMVTRAAFQYIRLTIFSLSSLLQKSTLAILDHFVLANTCINTEVMESDPKGYPPDSKFFDPKSKTFLAAVSHRDAKVGLHEVGLCCNVHTVNYEIHAVLYSYAIS